MLTACMAGSPSHCPWSLPSLLCWKHSSHVMLQSQWTGRKHEWWSVVTLHKCQLWLEQSPSGFWNCPAGTLLRLIHQTFLPSSLSQNLGLYLDKPVPSHPQPPVSLFPKHYPNTVHLFLFLWRTLSKSRDSFIYSAICSSISCLTYLR